MRPRQNGCHFANNIFRCIFLNESCCILIQMALNSVPRGLIDNISVLVQKMAWLRLGDTPLSEPWIALFSDIQTYVFRCLNELTHLPLVPRICVRESGEHRFRKWLVTYSAPSHYLKQCLLIVNWTLRNKLQWNFNQNSTIFIQENAFENVVCKMVAILSRGRWVNNILQKHAAWQSTWPMNSGCCLPNVTYPTPSPKISVNITKLGHFDHLQFQVHRNDDIAVLVSPTQGTTHDVESSTPDDLNSSPPRQNGCHFADDIFKCIFVNGNIWIWNKISLKQVPWGPIDNMSALVQIMAWCLPGDKPLSEPMLIQFTNAYMREMS